MSMISKYIYGKNYKNYLLELHYILEQDPSNYTLKDLINEFVSKFVTPEKIVEILSSDDIVNFGLQYDEGQKKLMYNNTEVTGLTKSFVILYILSYYSLSQVENFENVSSSFIERSYSILKSLLIRKTLLQRTELNVEIIVEILDEVTKKSSVTGIVLVIISILLLATESMNVKRAILLEFANVITMTGEKFAVSLYYLLDKMRVLSPDNLFLNFLPEEIYNNLYATNIVELPLPIIKEKIQKITSKETNQQQNTQNQQNKNNVTNNKDNKTTKKQEDKKSSSNDPFSSSNSSSDEGDIFG